MERNDGYEQEIDLKDLLFAVLYKWRLIILVAVALGLLLGGYRIGKEIIQQRDVEYVEEVQEKYQKSLDDYEKTGASYERELKNIKINLDTKSEYLEKSLLMQISPYDKCTATADVFIKLDDALVEDGMVYMPIGYTNNSIVKAYVTYLNRGIDLEPLARRMGTEVKYLKELISISPDYDSNMLSVSVSYTNEGGAEKILEELLDGIDDEYDDLQEKLGPHTIYVMNKDYDSATDINLASKQKSSEDEFVSLQTSLKNKEKAIEDLEKPEAPAILSKRVLAISGIKYAILGGVLGAFMVIFFICVSFLMSDKVATAKELKRRFRIRLIGAFPQQQKKRAFSGIDRWLKRMEGKEDSISEEARYELIAENLRNYSGDAKNVLVVGTVEKELLEEVSAKLKSLCPQIDLIVGEGLNQNASTVRLLAQCDGVVVVERCGESRYDAIEKEIEAICNMDKPVLGAVVY